MPYDILDKLSDPNIESKVELIKYLIKRTRQGQSNDLFSESIEDYLSETEQFSYLSSYCLVGQKHALGCLLGHFLSHYTLEKDLTKQTTLLIKLLDYAKHFKSSKSALLKKTTTIKLINVLDAFGIPAHFLRTWDYRPLRIYYIPYERADFNAAYYPYINSIATYRPKENSSPEYIFLHEIGHLITYNITGEPDKVPESFIEFNEKINPGWKKDLIEVFVDLFSLAVMIETDFAHKNPFIPIISTQKQKLIRDYFITLVSDLKYAKSIRI